MFFTSLEIVVTNYCVVVSAKARRDCRRLYWYFSKSLKIRFVCIAHFSDRSN